MDKIIGFGLTLFEFGVMFVGVWICFIVTVCIFKYLEPKREEHLIDQLMRAQKKIAEQLKNGGKL